MSNHLIITTLAALSLALVTANASADWRPYHGGIEVDVVNDSGSVLPQYAVESYGRKQRVQRAYLEAERDEPYAIKVRNNSDRRVGLVIAVDGRNIISGAKSELDPEERMYVLKPGEARVYEGWRTGKNRVNRFYFTEPEDSYAEAFGDDSAMGIVAVAAFREQRRKRYYADSDKTTEQGMQPRSGIAPDRAPARQSEEAGTGFGEETWSPSRRVKFQPEDRAWRKVFLKYEWRQTLCDRGIIECRRGRSWNRFWPQPPNGGYAPPPPGYRPW